MAELEGLNEVVAKLNLTIHEMRLSSEGSLRTLAYDTINEAKKLCPVDSGRLRASLGGGSDGVAPDGVKRESDARGPSVVIGTHVDYAPFVEFGTQNHGAAQPYLRPALEITRARLLTQLRSTIRQDVPTVT